jgi:hypothetical protein
MCFGLLGYNNLSNNMELRRFLLALTNKESEDRQYILHTQYPRALIEVTDNGKKEYVISKTYSYLLQNEVEPRQYTLKIAQAYEPANDWDNVLDEAWQWHLSNVLAA